MIRLLAITASALTLFSGRLSAAQVVDQKYFTVDPESIVVEEVSDRGGELPTIPSPAQLPVPASPVFGSGIPFPNASVTRPDPADLTGSLNQVGAVVGTIDQIVNLVDKVWTLIAKNQPVVNVKVNYANAVPYGLTHWTQLQGWSKPAVRKYRFYFKNLYGVKVVDISYQLQFTHSGNYKGKGKYLTGVTVEPTRVSTAWGYNVDLTAEVPDSTIANVGTTADPIASMQVQLKWKVHTIIKDMQGKDIFYVQGNGLMQPISKAYERGIEQKNAEKLKALPQQPKF